MRITLLILIFISISSIANAGSLNISVWKNSRVTVTYLFDEEKEKITFLDERSGARIKTLKLLSDCVSFDGADVITNEGCNKFSKIEFELIDEIFIGNRQYPLGIFSSDGKNIAINVGLLNIDNGIKNVKITSEESLNKIVIYKGKKYKNKHQFLSKEISNRSAEYIYISDEVKLKDNIYISVDEGAPKWISDTILERSSQIASLYGEHLSVKRRKSSLIIVSYYPESNGSRWWGDVDANGTISLRFYGARWKNYNEDAYKNVIHFLAHEIFHLFNSIYARSQDNVASPWLHEGSAEAGASVALLKLGIINPLEFNEKYLAKLNSCRQFHLESTMNRGINKVPYDCGFLLNFTLKDSLPCAEGAPCESTIEHEGFFLLWKNILQSSEKTGFYNKKVFFDYSDLKGPLSIEDLERVVTPSGSQVNPVDNMLRKLNIEFGYSHLNQDSFRLGKAIISSILKENCKGRYGFSSEKNSVVVEHNDGCRGFTKSFEVTKINGFDIYKDSISLNESLLHCKNVLLEGSSGARAVTLNCPKSPQDINKFKSIVIKKLTSDITDI